MCPSELQRLLVSTLRFGSPLLLLVERTYAQVGVLQAALVASSTLSIQSFPKRTFSVRIASQSLIRIAQAGKCLTFKFAISEIAREIVAGRFSDP